MVIICFDLFAQLLSTLHSDGYCLQQIGFYAWYLLYPLVFFATVKSDSSYHWQFASQPLIESTQQSIADLDLFSLPGYQYFDRTMDDKFRFKKLQQFVSSFVPIIAFDKIKFDQTMVGSGSTSQVLRGSYKSMPVAIKCL